MKKMNLLATAAALSDQDLLARLAALAGRERDTLVELVAHLIALDDRPGAYSAQGYGSLFTAIARRPFGSPRMPRARASRSRARAGASP